MVRSPSLVDMTSGSIIKKALIFAIPICVEISCSSFTVQ